MVGCCSADKEGSRETKISRLLFSFFMDILYDVSKMRYPRAKLFNDDYTVLDDSFKIGEKKSLLHLMINDNETF